MNTHRFSLDHEEGLEVCLEDLMLMLLSQQQQINVLAMALSKFQYINETGEGSYTAPAYIVFGMTEVVPPSVGGMLELWSGFVATDKGEILKVDHCNVDIDAEDTIAYVEIVETVSPFGPRTLEDNGENVNVIFERKGVIKTTPVYAALPAETEAYIIYRGSNRVMKNSKEVITELINQ